MTEFFNKEERERKLLGEKGHQLVKDHFTWQSSAKKMLGLYKSIIFQETKPEFVYE